MAVATGSVTFRVPPDLKEELEQRAAENYRSLSKEIQFLIAQGLAASMGQPMPSAPRKKAGAAK